MLWNPRDFSSNTYRSVDDRPYGGGPGMVMMAEPLAKALRAARLRQVSCGVKRTLTIFLSPQGRPLTQSIVEELGGYQGFVLLAGRYEGVDERVLDGTASRGGRGLCIVRWRIAGDGIDGCVDTTDSGYLNDAESAQQNLSRIAGFPAIYPAGYMKRCGSAVLCQDITRRLRGGA